MAGNAKELGESRTQALQALLGSLSGEQESVNGNLTPRQVQSLSSKIGELLGDGSLGDEPTHHRNEKGQLVNEEGLPVIDISEPATGVDPSQPNVSENDLVPLSSLTSLERARRRLERDRILDALEEEEAIEEAKAAEMEEEERRDTLEKRKNAARQELDKLKAAREMQKRMGKALLQNMAEAREREEKAQVDISETKHESGKPKKTVKFVEKETGSGWGDVVPARLRATKPLVKEGRVMKMDVVERNSRSTPSPEPILDERDSDDESAPGSPVPADSDEGEVIHSDDDEDQPRPGAAPQSDSEDEENEEPLLEEEYDLDEAHHQREIALEYYKKRGMVGAEASQAMTSHTHEPGEDEWDQPEVPLDATLSSRPKPSVSRFKASRIASSYNNASSPSTSLGPSVIPASRYQTTVQRAIRTGKLEDGQLVDAATGESEDEDESVKEVLELLKKGQLTNVGPEFQVIPPTGTATKDAKPSRGIAQPRPQLNIKNDTPNSPANSGSNTPVSNVNRSSPKLSTNPSTPTSLPPSSSSIDKTASSKTSSQPPPMIVESPSFLRSTGPPLSSPLAYATVIDSPSFRPLAGSPLSATSTIVASPSFPPRSVVLPLVSPQEVGTPQTPVVMFTAVRESIPGHAPISDLAENEAPGRKRVSRFKSERTAS